jgi:uncharacterized protein (UPF0147 family)
MKKQGEFSAFADGRGITYCWQIGAIERLLRKVLNKQTFPKLVRNAMKTNFTILKNMRETARSAE